MWLVEIIRQEVNAVVKPDIFPLLTYLLFIYRTDIVPKVTIFFYKYTKHKNITVVLDHEEHKIAKKNAQYTY
jgi:hypothetical protein